MSFGHTRPDMPVRNSALRHYIDRHSGFVVCTSLGFAMVSCFALVLLFGAYASVGGDNGAVMTIGLCFWLCFNGWAIRRFITSLRRRAAAESERLRFERFKPLQQTG